MTDGVFWGSLSDPIATSTYSSHFITYPVFISWFYYIFGYHINIPSFLNSFIELLTIFTLSISSIYIFNIKKYWPVFPIVYCLSPAMNLFGTSQLSETFSSFIILINVLSVIYYFQKINKLNLSILLISFFLAIFTRRENLVLIIFILIISFFEWLKDKKIKIFMPLLFSALIATIFFTFVQNIFKLNIIESSEIHTNNFSLEYLNKLFPIFIRALFSFKWLSISFTLFILASIFFIYTWKNNKIIISLIVLYLSFLFVYCFHYRNYDFIYSGYVQPFVVLRYLNNFYEILVIVLSIFLIKLIEYTSFKKLIFIILSILIVTSFTSTLSLRHEYSKYEIAERFLKPQKILDFLKKKTNYILITDDILIFQLLGPDNLEICDINSINKFLSKIRNEDKYIYLTSSYYNKNYRRRYLDVVKIIQSLKLSKVLALGDQDILYKIVKY